MGAAAYNRGSAVVGRSIQAAYDVAGARQRELLARMVEISEAADQFCQKAQSLFVDAKDPETALGLLKWHMHCRYLKVASTKKWATIHAECCAAHAAWVDVDSRDAAAYLQASLRKAAAWVAVLELLNRSYHLPFSMPAVKPFQPSRGSGHVSH